MSHHCCFYDIQITVINFINFLLWQCFLYNKIETSQQQRNPFRLRPSCTMLHGNFLIHSFQFFFCLLSHPTSLLGVQHIFIELFTSKTPTSFYSSRMFDVPKRTKANLPVIFGRTIDNLLQQILSNALDEFVNSWLR